MKKSFLILLLSIVILSFQNEKQVKGIFEYEQIETKDKNFKSYITFYNLNVNNEFSTYTQIFNDELDEKYTEDTDEGINDVIVIKPKKNEMKIVFNEFVKNEMFFKDIIAFDILYVKEETIKMEWKIYDDTKNFGKRKCRKATTNFRGRTYTAWYSPDIKTNIGPWKFKDTPGLIFEIYDNDKILHIKLNTLNTKKYSNINSWENEKIKKVISLKEYKIKKDKEEDAILERLNSKLPKGSKPFIRNNNIREIEIFQK
jgi:GLPGLI family protein